MSKGAQALRKTPAARSAKTTAAPESKELLSEVQAFASQLGLGGGEHAFDDFAPKQSKEKLQSAPKRKRAQEDESADSDVDDAAADAKPEPRGKRKKRDKAAAANVGTTGTDGPFIPPVSEEMAAAIKERTWNSGVGPRPGEGKRSLMARDGPVLWHEAAAELPALPPVAARPSEALVEEMRRRGAALLEREAEVFEAEMGRKNGQDARWLQQVRRSGTTSDKVAALTLLLQESAVANVKGLDTLVGWVARRKGGRTVVGQAIDAGREIFATVLLPDRKLRWLSQQPLQALDRGRDGERRLLLWTLEDALKQRYATFIAALESGSKDNLEWVKERALRAACELLLKKPEGEAALLTLLVNKLGDPSRKLASKAGYLLGTVLAEHPGMKAVVVAEVQRFLFRAGLQERARYYAVVFLNQLQLSHHPSHGGGDLAKQLISVYLTLFQLIMSGKVGHAAAAHRAAEERAEAARLARRSAKGKGRGGRKDKQAPKALDTRAVLGTRSVEEVDARMLGALVAGVRRAFPYVPEGEVEALVEEHSAALFRVCHTAPLGVSLQVLSLLLQLMAGRRAVSDRFYRALYAVMLSPEVGRTSKAPLFVSLVFKAMKADVSVKRVAAFAKRLLQIATQAPAPFAAGTLFLLSEVLKVKAALWPAILQPEEAAGGIEHFRDAEEPQEAPAQSPAAETAAADDDVSTPEAPQAATATGAGIALDGKQAAEAPWPREGGYDMSKREALYCGAESSCWWELAALAAHAHPSVTAMARTLLAGDPVVYDGDPLRDLALPAFLDKFVRRKQKAKTRGGSIMQPLPQVDSAAGAAAALEPGSHAFASLATEDVRADAVFFHKFYSAQEARAPRQQPREGSEDDDSEEEIDAVLEEEEEAGGEGPEAVLDGGYDYSALEEALRSGGRGDPSDSNGSGGDSLDGGDAEDASDAEDGSVAGGDSDDDDSMEGLNPLELASPTSSEDGHVNNLDSDDLDDDDVDSEAEDGSGADDSDSDGFEAEFGAAFTGSASDEDGEIAAPGSKRGGKRRGGGGLGDFASADDWAARIEDAEAAAAAAAKEAHASGDQLQAQRTGGTQRRRQTTKQG